MTKSKNIIMTFKTREYESCDIRLTLKYELTKTFMTFCIFYHLMFKRRDAIAKKPFLILYLKN